MATSDAKRLGYGGSGVVDGQQVLITSGGFNHEFARSYLEPLSLPAEVVTRSRVEHADGTRGYSGDISFDVTANALSVLTTSKLLARRYSFDVGIHDGEAAQKMLGVYVSSLSLSGAPGGLITASLSVTGASAPKAASTVTNAFIRDQTPYGYWYSGNTDVKDWSFSFNQATTPMYINEDDESPRYIKVGLIDCSLEVNTYEAVRTHKVINIATSSFTLTGDTASEGFQFLGQTELGQYSHMFESAANMDAGSSGIIIT
tara:strand:+ start:314 stop:1090 length:777 start_codon:yes stop_codon:yes gene_type:complete